MRVTDLPQTLLLTTAASIGFALFYQDPYHPRIPQSCLWPDMRENEILLPMGRASFKIRWNGRPPLSLTFPLLTYFVPCLAIEYFFNRRITELHGNSMTFTTQIIRIVQSLNGVGLLSFMSKATRTQVPSLALTKSPLASTRLLSHLGKDLFHQHQPPL